MRELPRGKRAGESAVRGLGLLALALLLSVPRAAGVRADDWPHWRGARRDGTTAERSGWDGKSWPLSQPVWTTRVGVGSSSPLVVGDRLYVLGWDDDREHVVCLDAATGRAVWKRSYPAPRYGRQATGDEGLYGGVTGTPEYDAEHGWLITLGCDGDLHVWNTRANGSRVWGCNLYELYQAPRRPKVGRSGRRDYGYTSSPLLYQQTVIVEVGAPTGTLMAWDLATGERRWASQADEPAGHSGGPVLLTVEDQPCVASITHRGVLVVSLSEGREGETVATYPWQTEFANNIATPAVRGSDLVVTSDYNQNRIARLRVAPGRVDKIWEQPLASKVCSPVIHGGHVYWASQEAHCLDWETGRPLWQGGRFGDAGSCLVTGDDRWIVCGQRGELALLETARRSPKDCRILAQVKTPLESDAWPHLVLAGGRLFVKDRNGWLVCYRLDQP